MLTLLSMSVADAMHDILHASVTFIFAVCAEQSVCNQTISVVHKLGILVI